MPDWSILDLHTDPLIFEHLSQFNVYNLCKLLTKNNFQIESLEKDIVVDDPSSPNRIVRVVAEFVDVPFFKNQFVDFFKKFYSNTSANWIDNLNKNIE